MMKIEDCETIRTILRQYSITTEADSYNIKNGRCPEYALNWDIQSNERHWPPGHDYFLGNGENINDNQELRRILSKKRQKGSLRNRLLFCDLDGVLTDFEKGIFNKYKKTTKEMNSSLMWALINKSNNFFETLPWMPRGQELWNAIKQYDPIILTGIPNGKKSEEQKRKWCARELGEDIAVIACSTKEKAKYCFKNSILIDDRTNNISAWNERGGQFILYDEHFTDIIIERIHQYMNE